MSQCIAYRVVQRTSRIRALPSYDPWHWHMCTQVVCTTLPREALEPMIGPLEVGFLVAHLSPTPHRGGVDIHDDDSDHDGIGDDGGGGDDDPCTGHTNGVERE